MEELSGLGIALIMSVILQAVLILSVVKTTQETKDISEKLYKTNELLKEILKHQSDEK